MNERVLLASPQRARGDIFEPQFLAMIGENLRAQTQALGMLTEILQISEVVAAGHYPGADPPNSCSLKDCRRRRKPFQVGIEGCRIIAEFDRQASRSKLQISFLQIIEEAMKHGDTLTRRMFEDIVIQEEEHYWKFDDYVR
jgi:hypothetical protein